MTFTSKAVTMQAYAKQARDGQLIEWAMDPVASRTQGWPLFFEMADRGERSKGGDPRSRPATLAKLDDLGVLSKLCGREDHRDLAHLFPFHCEGKTR
jgi:hypothetical protein